MTHTLQRLYAEAKAEDDENVFIQMLVEGVITVLEQTPEDQELTDAFIERMRHGKLH